MTHLISRSPGDICLQRRRNWRYCLPRSRPPSQLSLRGLRFSEEGGGDRGVNLPSPYFLSQFLPPPYFFEPVSPSSLNGYVSFSPSSQLFWGHFFLLPILFLPPLREDKGVQGGHTAGGQKITRDYKLSVKQNFTVRVTQQPGTS